MKKLITPLILLVVFNLTQAVPAPLLLSPHPIIKKEFDDNVKMKITFGDQTYEILAYILNYAQLDDNSTPPPVDPFNTRSSTITITMRPSKVDQGFLNWLLSSKQDAKDGQIVVYDGDSGKTLRTITFSGVKTASYNENSNAVNYNTYQQVSISFRYKTIAIKLGN